MMKMCKVLALMLVAPAVFGQARGALPVQSANQIKILRGEIRRDQEDLAAKSKSVHAARAQLLAQEKEELGRIRKSGSSRPNRAAARKSVVAKYAALWAQRRRAILAEESALREDIAAKKASIRKLRRS